MVASGTHGCQSPYHVDGRFPTTLERLYYRLNNWIYCYLYPVRPLQFFSSILIITAIYHKCSSCDIANVSFTSIFRVILLALLTCYIPLWLFRCFLKHFFFSYKGFLFEKPANLSTTTKIWGICRTIIANLPPPRLRSCEPLLPRLPVPDLKETIERYLDSIQPVVGNDEFLNVTTMANRFLVQEGKWLQWLTKFYSLFVFNYVTNVWEKYAYLYSRNGLLIHSSVAHCDLFKNQPAKQAVRAAHITYIETLSMLAIDRQAITPIAGGMFCTSHYRKCYATSRIPGETVDCWKSYGLSRHVLVLHKGKFYRLEVFDENDEIYSLAHLSAAYEEILKTEDDPDVSEKYIAAFTTDKRDSWCKNRKKFFIENSVNREALKIIESAIFVVILDESNEYDYIPDQPEVLDKFMKSMLTGNGINRWADKSLNYTIAANGRCGGTTEHSVADGAEFDHIMENFVFMDNKILQYPNVGESVQKILEDYQRGRSLKQKVKHAERLKLDISSEMAAEAERCYNAYQKKKNDVDCKCLIFTKFGKGRIKKGNVSPDAFIQMAIQLAYYKDQGKFGLTYESASTRFYANSRTETLRSVTKESCAFVKSMVDKHYTNVERFQLLTEATAVHTQHNRECMVGKGVDRHLFVLFVLSKMFGLESRFLDYYINQPWLLSTSQPPNMTSQMNEDAEPNYSWLGAAFGAVAHDGYGVCYRFAGNHSICLHTTSYYSSQKTDSARFKHHIICALEQMEVLLEQK